MKTKAILILAALLMVVSGVAAVSAYEAHIINVKAHVENALTVNTAEIDFGTVFPEEYFMEERNISLSESALAELGNGEEGDLENVNYEIFAEYKIFEPGDPQPTYYRWLGDWLWVDMDGEMPSGDTMGDWTNVGAQPDATFANDGTEQANAPSPMAKGTGHTGQLNDANREDDLSVLLLTPCFHGYYNIDTDIKPDWWPLGTWPLLDQDLHDGVDLGLDLKVQITSITRVAQ